MNILLVEADIDGPDISAAIKPDLKGCYIVTCFSGRAALDIINREFEPDIAVIDAALPDLNWLTLVDMLRLQPKHVYTIMMISRESGDDPGLILEAGVDDYIFKPVDYDDLSHKLKKALQEKGHPDLLSGAPQKSPAPEISSGERIEARIINYGEPKEQPADPAGDEQMPGSDSSAEQIQVDPASFILLRPLIHRFSEEAAVSAHADAQKNSPEPLLIQTADGPIQPKPKYKIGPQPKYLPVPLPEESFAEAAPAPVESGRQFGSEFDQRRIIIPPRPQPRPILPEKREQPRRPVQIKAQLRPLMRIAGWLLPFVVLLLISVFTVFLVQSRVGQGVANLFGYQAHSAAAFDGRPGNLLLIGEAGLGELLPGDIITTGSVRQDEMVFYRVVSVNAEQQTVLAESGAVHRAQTLAIIANADITGQVDHTIPYLGYLPPFLHTLAGLIALVLAPGLLIMAGAGRNIYRILFSGSSKNLWLQRRSLAQSMIILLLAGLIISAASAAWLSSPDPVGSGSDRRQLAHLDDIFG